jgi:hypothetical protein
MQESKQLTIRDKEVRHNTPDKYIFGRPTKYRQAYCKLIIDYFSTEPNKEIELPHYKNEQLVWTEQKLQSNKLPTFHGFARLIGLTDTGTLLEWAKKFPDFSHAYAQAKELQKYFIAENGLNNVYNANFAQFVLSNITDWQQRQAEKEQANNVTIQVMFPPNERDKREISEGNIIQIKGETIKDK